MKYYQSYEDGFKAYLNQDFSFAANVFHNCLIFKPDDLAAKVMIDRIETLDKNSLPKDWDGSVALTSKWDYHLGHISLIQKIQIYWAPFVYYGKN